MMWVAQHYHISPAGESTSCREMLNVWLQREVKLYGEGIDFIRRTFLYCAPVLDVLTGCMTCDCDVLTSVVDDGIFRDKVPC
jgi:hypothetical protein